MTGRGRATASGGVAFEDGADRGRILVFGSETGGQYSLMEWVVGPASAPALAAEPDYGPHRHRAIDETFYVRRGSLEFLLGDEVRTLRARDFIRVTPGARHGYANISGEEVELLVVFHPGGFEELFLGRRSDQEPQPPAGGFIEEAIRRFGSECERS